MERGTVRERLARVRRPAVVIAACVVALGCTSTTRGDPPAVPPAPTTPTADAGATRRSSATATTAAPRCAPDGDAPPRSPSEPISTAVTRWRGNPVWQRVAVSASVWIEGYGEVLAREPNRRLLPASNQKLITAAGVLTLLPPDMLLTTRVVSTTEPRHGVVDGDLVLVGGGDPTLTRRGPHSLDELAARVRAAGIMTVRGTLVVDESRHQRARRAPGWQTWHVPTYAGPLSALMVDDNRYRTDAEYLNDPAVANADVFLEALHRHGVAIGGRTERGTAPPRPHAVASLSSHTAAELVRDMLLHSDNEIAEVLTREAGRRTAHVGNTEAGTRAFARVLASLCVETRGESRDGSGLSRTNRRSARELRALLQAAMRASWWPHFSAGLPVAARSGTLTRRFHGTAAANNLRAKTGTITGGCALSGYLMTAGARRVVFSMIVNGEETRAAQDAIDDFLASLAVDTS
jgi:serine-type D-Ala-D-Ala carboxypeptidase/endopeptidase (penicillin-binding protein 4)